MVRTLFTPTLCGIAVLAIPIWTEANVKPVEFRVQYEATDGCVTEIFVPYNDQQKGRNLYWGRHRKRSDLGGGTRFIWKLEPKGTVLTDVEWSIRSKRTPGDFSICPDLDFGGHTSVECMGAVSSEDREHKWSYQVVAKHTGSAECEPDPFILDPTLIFKKGSGGSLSFFFTRTSFIAAILLALLLFFFWIYRSRKRSA